MPDKFYSFLERFADIRAHEVRATVTSFLFVFILMGAYYIMRPMRDAMSSDWTDAELSTLWTIGFAGSFGVVALYSFALSTFKFKRVLPTVYSLFPLSFLGFYLYFHLVPDRGLVDKVFYVWVGIFSLFHVSVFWSFMSDIFSKAQAGRLFDTIAAGATAGALVGPAIPTLLAGHVGADTMILIAAILLIAPIFLVIYLARLKHSELHNDNVHADLSNVTMGGKTFAGFRLFATNPYLLGIAAFIFLYTVLDAFVYFEQKNLLAVYDRETRTQILGGIDWAANFLTIGLAFFATSKLLKRAGMGRTLAILPVLMIVSLLALAVAPTVAVLFVLQALRRSSNYGLVRSAREMLFTAVDRESRYKAKPVIDIVVYRGGNMVSSWLIVGLTAGLGLGIPGIALVGAAIAAVWCGCGLLLGRYFEANNPPDPNIFRGAGQS